MSDENTESILYVETLIVKEKNKIVNLILIKPNRDKEQNILNFLKNTILRLNFS